MPTTFNVIFLGTAADMDPTEGNTTSENLAGIVGSTFGGVGNPLYLNVGTWSPVGSPGNTYDINNNPDQFSVNGITYRYDGGGGFNATVTYADGTTATVVAKIAQSITGELFLTSETAGQEANQALLDAKPILSLTINAAQASTPGMAADRLTGNFMEPVDGTGGNDNMGVGYTDAAGDAVTDGADVIRAGDGNDTINAGGGGDVIFGGVGNDLIDSWSGSDSVYGGAGDDTLSPGTGADTLHGDSGNDLIEIWDNAGTVSTFGGDGFDALDFRNWQSSTGASVTFNPDGSGSFSHFAGATTGTFQGFERVTGTANADTMIATAATLGVNLAGEEGDDSLTGGAGADQLFGGDGQDVLNGGVGNDSISGGYGNDSITAGAGDDWVTDEFAGNTTLGGADTVDLGNGNDVFVGSGQNIGDSDLIYGGLGADTITVREAYDTVYGGDGNDSITTTNEDLIYGDALFGDAGDDTITGANTDDMLYGGTGADRLFGGGNTDTLLGGDGADSLDGGSENDLLEGGLGDDTLVGGTGSDTLLGDDGNDTLNGGTGADSLFGGNGADTFIVQDGFGSDTITAGESTGHSDTVDLSALTAGVSAAVNSEAGSITSGTDSISFTQVENFILTNHADTFSTQYSAGSVLAGGGNDTVSTLGNGYVVDGGGGNDSITSTSGQVSLYGGQGDDTLVFGFNGRGLLDGGDGNDQLLGSSNTDTIFGGAGNDTIRAGGGGADVLVGGSGADTFQVAPVGGTPGIGLGSVTIDGGEADAATDTVTFAGHTAAVIVTYTGNEAATFTDGVTSGQFTGIEALVLTAQSDVVNAAASGAGVNVDAGAGNDSLTGGSGVDTLSGGSGNDLLAGGMGADSLVGGAGTDTVTYATSATSVTVNLTTGMHSGGDAAGDTLTGIENVTGSAFGDSLTGDAAANVLSGGDGDDTLTGGASNDSIVTGNGSDMVILAHAGGGDIVTDFDLTLVSGKTTDQLDVSDLVNASGNPVTWRDVTVTDTNGDGTGDAILTFPNGENITLQGITPDMVDGKHEMARMGIPCFAAGSPILTSSGLRRIETLARGDIVETQSGPAPVIWAGSCSLGPDDLAANPDQLPIHFATGAIGNSVPLRLSPQHAVQILGADGLPVLVRAKHMAEAGLQGVRVARGVKSLTYHHLLLGRHSTLSAAGAIVESMYPGPIALASFPVATRLAIAVAIIGRHFGGISSVIDLADLSQIYGPRRLPLLGRKEALLACRTGRTLQPLAIKPPLLKPFGAPHVLPEPKKTQEPIVCFA